MKYLIGAFTLLLLLNCNIDSEDLSQTEVSIQVQNKTEYVLTDVSIFSIGIGTLNPGETSRNEFLYYNKLESDPMIYMNVKGYKFGKYLFADTLNNSTYVIDSLDFNSKQIYLSLNRE